MLTGMYWTSLLNNWVRRLLTSNRKSLLLRLPPHFLYKLYEADSLVDELVLWVRDDALLSKDCIDKSSEVDMATSSSFLSTSICSITELTVSAPPAESSPCWSSGLKSSEANLWNCVEILLLELFYTFKMKSYILSVLDYLTITTFMDFAQFELNFLF